MEARERCDFNQIKENQTIPLHVNDNFGARERCDFNQIRENQPIPLHFNDNLQHF